MPFLEAIFKTTWNFIMNKENGIIAWIFYEEIRDKWFVYFACCLCAGTQ